MNNYNIVFSFSKSKPIFIYFNLKFYILKFKVGIFKTCQSFQRVSQNLKNKESFSFNRKCNKIIYWFLWLFFAFLLKITINSLLNKCKNFNDLKKGELTTFMEFMTKICEFLKKSL